MTSDFPIRSLTAEDAGPHTHPATIPLFSFIAIDPRPSLVLNASDGSIEHSNDAFSSWRASMVKATPTGSLDTTDSVGAWLRTLSHTDRSYQSSYGGVNWLLAPLLSQWIVITSLEDPCLPQLPVGRPETDKTALVPSLDWTRQNLDGLSDHLRMVKSYPWETTNLGHISLWTETLRQIVLSMMANPTPQILLWGSSWTMIYNEACGPLLGQKHPASLGDKAANVWQEAMVFLDPIISGVMSTATGVQLPSAPVIMYRQGYHEETFWNINLTPVIGASGDCLGVVDQFTDNTEGTVRERRRKTATDLDTALSPIRTLSALWSQVLDSLKQAPADIPYAILYTSDSFKSSGTIGSDDGQAVLSLMHSLHGSFGIEDPAMLPQVIDASQLCSGQSIATACQKAWQSRSTITLRAGDKSLPTLLAKHVPAQPGCENRVDAVLTIPLWDVSRKSCLGFLVIALNPNRPFDDAAVHFIEELGKIIRNYAQRIFFPQAQNRLLQQFEKVETTLEQQVREQQIQTQKIGARLEKIFKMAPIGVFSVNPEGRCVFFNDAYLRIVGFCAEQFEDPAFRASSAAHDEDRERVLSIWKRCLLDHQPICIEYRLKKPWSQYNESTKETVISDTWVFATATCEVDEHGDLVMVTGFLVDISERKWNEEQRHIRADAERTEAPFRKLAESAPMGVYHLRADGTPIYINDAYFDLLGVGREYEDKLNRSMDWTEHIFAEDVARLEVAWYDLIRDGTPLNLEYRVKKPWHYYDSVTDREKSGVTWLQGTAIADRDAQGRTQSVLGFVTEISAKKFSETLLAERLEEALETKRQADRFIDMTSHEMRNPLSAILQSADAILTALTEDIPTESDEFVSAPVDPAVLAETVVDATQTIILCAQHQKRIVDDILTLSKLDTKLLVIVPDKASPVELLKKSIKMYEAEIRQAEVEVSLEVEDSYHSLQLGKAMLDSSRLLQVIINLLTNAVKFTQRSANKRITIYLGGSATQPITSFHKAAFVPQKPGRADPTVSPDWGTGATAYLQIAVEDSGCGLSPDELKVMFQRFAQASPKTYKQYGGSGLGLFISRELTELQGGQIGVHSEAGQGSTFTFYVKVRQCLVNDDLEEFDDQRTTMRSASSVIAGQRTNSLQPVRSYSATCEPKSSVMVQPTIDETNGRIAKPSLLGLHILIVEDNVINQRVMASQLRQMGSTVHIAHHGGEALQFLGATTFWDSTKAPVPSATMYMENDRSHSLGLRPSSRSNIADPTTPPLTPCVPLSVILMDLEMPVLGGLDTVKEIRRLERLGHLKGHVPVIAITANARSEQISNAISEGMDSVVTKPFRIPDLIPLIENVLEHRAK